tara:strand:+ start:947 stop:1780 length:834 start_codon:yes stop_codon:yes gene_type:complete
MGRNSNRLGTDNKPEHSDAPPMSPLNFVAPTEVVDLPSKGQGYPEDHPLNGVDFLEIKFMTAKDEDTLSNQSLIRKGIALERVIQNIIVDDEIDPLSLLVCDRNAILIKARATAYGANYDAMVNCPKCATQNMMTFDLMSPKIEGGLDEESLKKVQYAGDGLYQTTMPGTKFTVKFRLANGEDENRIMEMAIQGKTVEYGAVEQYKKMIKSIEEFTEEEVIHSYVDNMIVSDATHFKACLRSCTTAIRIAQTLTCKSCSNEQEVDVPFGTDFFWPNI